MDAAGVLKVLIGAFAEGLGILPRQVGEKALSRPAAVPDTTADDRFAFLPAFFLDGNRRFLNAHRIGFKPQLGRRCYRVLSG